MQTLTATADLNSDMSRVFAEANRNNTSIYAVDPRGLAVFEYGINEAIGLQQDATGLRMSLDTLHALANNTDGRAIVNRNDLAAGMKQIIRDASGYYLLGYNSTQAPTDGKFHGIKVNVKRRGLDVRARKGYWAYTTEDVARANAAASKPEAPTAVTSALKDLAAPVRDRSAHFWIGTARGENGATRVTFLWEPVPPIPGQPVETPPARVSLTALSRDGRPLYRARVPEQPLASTGAPPTAGVAEGGVTSFDVPPGQLELRIVVEGGRGQVIDSVARELTVPDFTKVQVSFGTPRVYRVRTVPELQALKSESRCRADGRSRIQPHRAAAHPAGQLCARRSDPGHHRTSSEPRRLGDVESARADARRAFRRNRSPAVRPRGRRVPHRADRQDRVGHGAGDDRVPGGEIEIKSSTRFQKANSRAFARRMPRALRRGLGGACRY